MAITRRELVKRGVLVGLPLAAGVRRLEALAALVEPYRGPVLVNVFLRGGADGLNIVPPVGEPRYFDLRPSLALKAPGDGDGSAIDLDGFFGLHPALKPIHPLFAQGSLAVVHAFGNPSDSHSHFSSQDYMERGRDSQTSDSTGWLGRHLATGASGNTSLFQAIAVGRAVQKSMIGGPSPLGIESVSAFRLDVRRADPARIRSTMLDLYDRRGVLDDTSWQVFAAMDTLEGIPSEDDAPGYPASDFGDGLKTAAQLIKADLGVEVASIDAGGWDHHAALRADLDARLSDLAAGLAAFGNDLGETMARVTVVVMTEFGRRAYENASGGTDHGHGSVMLALGAGVNGGRVYGEWPGLAESVLYGAGDLAVATDFRTVLGELLARRFPGADPAAVFADFASPAFLGVFRAG
jgi:uncharacterized protein (DUF1501 family)